MKLAGEAASDFRVEAARASAARGVLAGVGTSPSAVASARLGVAAGCTVDDSCNASLLGERLLDLLLNSFGVVGLETSSFLALFAGRASRGAEEVAAELRDL